MNLRALIVLLAVLNLGVATWWLFRPDTPAVVTEETPSGVARLQLVGERSAARPAPAVAKTTTPSESRPEATPAPAAPPEQAQTPVATPAPRERCYALGPFTDADALASARAALRAGALRLRTREIREGGGRGWRVFLPPAADHETADATAAKIRAAGFSDLLVVANGTDANSIALGRFSSEARARQHAETVRAAGFAAKAEPLGEIRISNWIDVAVADTFNIATARRASGAAQSRNLDCREVP